MSYFLFKIFRFIFEYIFYTPLTHTLMSNASFQIPSSKSQKLVSIQNEQRQRSKNSTRSRGSHKLKISKHKIEKVKSLHRTPSGREPRQKKNLRKESLQSYGKEDVVDYMSTDSLILDSGLTNNEETLVRAQDKPQSHDTSVDSNTHSQDTSEVKTQQSQDNSDVKTQQLQNENSSFNVDTQSNSKLDLDAANTDFETRPSSSSTEVNLSQQTVESAQSGVQTSTESNRDDTQENTRVPQFYLKATDSKDRPSRNDARKAPESRGKTKRSAFQLSGGKKTEYSGRSSAGNKTRPRTARQDSQQLPAKSSMNIKDSQSVVTACHKCKRSEEEGRIYCLKCGRKIRVVTQSKDFVLDKTLQMIKTPEVQEKRRDAKDSGNNRRKSSTKRKGKQKTSRKRKASAEDGKLKPSKSYASITKVNLSDGITSEKRAQEVDGTSLKNVTDGSSNSNVISDTSNVVSANSNVTQTSVSLNITEAHDSLNVTEDGATSNSTSANSNITESREQFKISGISSIEIKHLLGTDYSSHEQIISDASSLAIKHLLGIECSNEQNISDPSSLAIKHLFSKDKSNEQNISDGTASGIKQILDKDEQTAAEEDRNEMMKADTYESYSENDIRSRLDMDDVLYLKDVLSINKTADKSQNTSRVINDDGSTREGNVFTTISFARDNKFVQELRQKVRELLSREFLHKIQSITELLNKEKFYFAELIKSMSFINSAESLLKFSADPNVPNSPSATKKTEFLERKLITVDENLTDLINKVKSYIQHLTQDVSTLKQWLCMILSNESMSAQLSSDVLEDFIQEINEAEKDANTMQDDLLAYYVRRNKVISEIFKHPQLAQNEHMLKTINYKQYIDLQLMLSTLRYKYFILHDVIITDDVLKSFILQD